MRPGWDTLSGSSSQLESTFPSLLNGRAFHHSFCTPNRGKTLADLQANLSASDYICCIAYFSWELLAVLLDI